MHGIITNRQDIYRYFVVSKELATFFKHKTPTPMQLCSIVTGIELYALEKNLTQRNRIYPDKMLEMVFGSSDSFHVVELPRLLRNHLLFKIPY